MSRHPARFGTSPAAGRDPRGGHARARLRQGSISVKTLPADERVPAKDRSRVIGAVALGVVLLVVAIGAVV